MPKKNTMKSKRGNARRLKGGFFGNMFGNIFGPSQSNKPAVPQMSEPKEGGSNIYNEDPAKIPEKMPTVTGGKRRSKTQKKKRTTR